MKKHLILIFLCAFQVINTVHSQAPSIQWQKCYGGTNAENPHDILQTNDGGYIVCGGSTSNSGDIHSHIGGLDYWIIKLDPLGVLVWEKSFGGTGDDRSLAIQQTVDGGYITAGFSTSTDGDGLGNHGAYDFLVIKLNAAGDIIWKKMLGGSQTDKLMSLSQTNDGGYIVAGETNSSDGDVTNNHGEADYWVVKLDGNGNISWQKTYGGSGSDYANSIKQTNDGGYILTGQTNSIDGDVVNPTGARIPWIVKLDAAGSVVWQKVYGSGIDFGESSYSVWQATDGSYVVANKSLSNGGDVTGHHAMSDYWIIKLDSNGNLVWQKALGGSEGEEPYYICQTIDGGFIVIGRTASTDGDVAGNHGASDVWIVKLSPAGVVEWQKAMGGNLWEYGYAVDQTTDAGFIVAAYSLSNNSGDVGPGHGNADYWIIKLAPEVLPVTLLNFDANASGKDVSCEWKTSQEQNSSHFIIERSSDALYFDEMGRVNASGNSVLPLGYHFVDQNALLVNHDYLFYRLRMVDIDGSFKNSDVVKVRLKASSSLSIYPNPVTNELNIAFTAAIDEEAIISITDHSGKLVYQNRKNIKQGKNIIVINANFLPGGGYILSLKGKTNYSGRFVKQNN